MQNELIEPFQAVRDLEASGGEEQNVDGGRTCAQGAGPQVVRHGPAMQSLVPPLRVTAAKPYDFVIRNGRIVDGTGCPWYAGDLAIRAGRVAAVGWLPGLSAHRTIDAHGMIVAPGFIDMLGQSEISILLNPHLPSKIYPGITTEITGEGGSIAPLNKDVIERDQVMWKHYGVQPTWRTFTGYFSRLRKQGIGINVASYVGATQVRRATATGHQRQQRWSG